LVVKRTTKHEFWRNFIVLHAGDGNENMVNPCLLIPPLSPPSTPATHSEPPPLAVWPWEVWLAAIEAKAVAKFEDKVTQPLDEPVFQCTFRHGPADAEEFQVVRAFEHLIGLFGQVFGQGEIEIVDLFLCYCAFIDPGLDLV